MRKRIHWLLFVSACVSLMLSACGGGDSSSTTLRGPGLTGIVGPAVSFGAYQQKTNNMLVEVKPGPVAFNAAPLANILYTDVKVCELNSTTDPSAKCLTIPHVLVDTGSVGLRILASKLSTLNLSAVTVGAQQDVWECYPFVIGGLWGKNAVADVTLGTQVAARVPIQLIQDGPGPQSTNDCNRAAGGTAAGLGVYQDDAMLKDAAMLGANGILGIGATELDCDSYCTAGNYGALGFYMYYQCPEAAADNTQCQATAVGANLQTYNPVAALPQHNNGVVLELPAVPYPGSPLVTGQLVFGVNTTQGSGTEVNNMVPLGAPQIALGVNPNTNSYLNVTTAYGGQSIANSYLDTGTNGLFFPDGGIAPCFGSTWYCPYSSLSRQATISSGDTGSNPVVVPFAVDNAEVLFGTNNVAFAGLAGAPPNNATTFAWGLPFFYGKRTYLSIWRNPTANNGPWYAWVNRG